jgi:hypothetical protein
MMYSVFNDGSRNFIASAVQLVENGWKEGEYVSVGANTIEEDSWIAAHNNYKNEEPERAFWDDEEDMTPLDYWVELHGTSDGFFEQFNDVEVQQ